LSARLKITVRGAVQGVGFRPFVYRLAGELGVKGWVRNSPQGLFIEAEGPQPSVESFLVRLEADRPPRSFIQSLESSWLDPVGYTNFEIRASETGGAKTALVLPDIATCPDCLREVFDPLNRRYSYPFTNCTNCGPRFSIIESLPYDRANTSMSSFIMCPRCQAEYDDPGDRRFHAQPNACPVCGPHLELWDRDGNVVAADGKATTISHENDRGAIARAAQAIREGRILAVKGLGGFHLMAAYHDEQAVRRLRARKHREEKPFALMFPSLESVKASCEVSALEERLLRSPEAPIVLLRRLSSAAGEAQVATLIAPGNPTLGVMLPYTPLHHLLMASFNFPVVATSGNLSDEPICTDEREAVGRLGRIADLFLVHNRPIVRHVDDSIVRVMMGREMVLRRARGYAPLPIQLPPVLEEPKPGAEAPVLSVGAHLKNTVALSVGSQVFVSQHIGDLETNEAFEAFRRVIADFQTLCEAVPTTVAADAHPDYLSTQFARDLGLAGPQSTARPMKLLSVQHHVAHVLSCMAENELAPPVLGVSWDGTGYGLDRTVWGGEFFLVTDKTCERVAHLRRFRLPGGDRAVKEPRRTALGLLYELFGEAAFATGKLAPTADLSPQELASFKTMLARNLNSPLTSSAGRLFDAVASLIDLRQQVHFEGQAAMELEFALGDIQTNDTYSLPVTRLPPGIQHPVSGIQYPASSTPHYELDWSPLIQGILADLDAGVSLGQMSVKFHNALAEAIVATAGEIGQKRVVLSGGCFQNRYLTERTVMRLREAGFRPYWHQRIPPNDGGISLGQIVAARRPGGSGVSY
jgi:hydrogenase maturation protein HypF